MSISFSGDALLASSGEEPASASSVSVFQLLEKYKRLEAENKAAQQRIQESRHETDKANTSLQRLKRELIEGENTLKRLNEDVDNLRSKKDVLVMRNKVILDQIEAEKMDENKLEDAFLQSMGTYSNIYKDAIRKLQYFGETLHLECICDTFKENHPQRQDQEMS